MVSKKCCFGIVIGIIVLAGVGVGIYFATVKSSGISTPTPAPEPIENPFKNLDIVVKTNLGSIKAFNLSTNEYHTKVNVEEAPYGITSFDYHNNRTIYYATTEPGVPIKSAFTQEHSSLPDYTGAWTKTAITVDQITGKIYVVDRLEGKIHVIDVLGEHHKVLISNLDEPRDVILMPIQGTMLIVQKSSILTASMSGGEPVEYLRAADVRSMAVSPLDPTIYYATPTNVMSYNTVTKETKTESTRQILSLAIIDDTLLMVTKDHKFLSCPIPRDNDDACTDLPNPSDIEKIEEVKTYGDFELIENSCYEDNGGCEHLCLLDNSEEGRKCACDDGSKLNSDGKTCSKV